MGKKGLTPLPLSYSEGGYIGHNFYKKLIKNTMKRPKIFKKDSGKGRGLFLENLTPKTVFW